jgi:hypothetical protein
MKFFIEWKIVDVLPLPTPWDSNVNPKLKTTEGQGVRAHSLAHSTIEG